jgi:hypothetical protein
MRHAVLQALVFAANTCGAVLLELAQILRDPRNIVLHAAYPQLIHTFVHRNCERCVTANCAAKTTAYAIVRGQVERRYTQANAALRSR